VPECEYGDGPFHHVKPDDLQDVLDFGNFDASATMDSIGCGCLCDHHWSGIKAWRESQSNQASDATSSDPMATDGAHDSASIAGAACAQSEATAVAVAAVTGEHIAVTGGGAAAAAAAAPSCPICDLEQQHFSRPGLLTALESDSKERGFNDLRLSGMATQGSSKGFNSKWRGKDATTDASVNEVMSTFAVARLQELAMEHQSERVPTLRDPLRGRPTLCLHHCCAFNESQIGLAVNGLEATMDHIQSLYGDQSEVPTHRGASAAWNFDGKAKPPCMREIALNRAALACLKQVYCFAPITFGEVATIFVEKLEALLEAHGTVEDWQAEFGVPQRREFLRFTHVDEVDLFRLLMRSGIVLSDFRESKNSCLCVLDCLTLTRGMASIRQAQPVEQQKERAARIVVAECRRELSELRSKQLARKDAGEWLGKGVAVQGEIAFAAHMAPILHQILRGIVYSQDRTSHPDPPAPVSIRTTETQTMKYRRRCGCSSACAP